MITWLSEQLAEFVPEGTAAGLAVIRTAGAAPVAAWQPASSAREPAFLAYSITKTFTAALLLILEGEGRLRVDDRLARWFPHVEGAGRITLRHLLNHTAGIPDYGPQRAYHDAVRATPSEPWSFERFAAETFDNGLRTAPGTRFEYSNPGYMLLKRIAEVVAEAPYAALVRERLARPLGLDRTFVAESIADLAALAPANSTLLDANATPRDVRQHYHPGWVSHGVVASTPSEIARFFDALSSGRIVSARALEEMLTLVPVGADPPKRPRDALDPVKAGYGLGVMGDLASPRWGHNGGGPGYSASAFHAADLGGATVCAMVSAEGGAERIVSSVLRALAERE